MSAHLPTFRTNSASHNVEPTQFSGCATDRVVELARRYRWLLDAPQPTGARMVFERVLAELHREIARRMAVAA